VNGDMRGILMLLGAAVIALPAIPVVHYRTLRPCEMLRHELVDQVRQQVAAARHDAQQSVREQAGAVAESLASTVGDVVSAVSVGVAAGAAEMRVQHMSTGQCASELWRIKVLGEEPRH
jgi:ABC-type tungstate transport system substrate-binding protein